MWNSFSELGVQEYLGKEWERYKTASPLELALTHWYLLHKGREPIALRDFYGIKGKIVTYYLGPQSSSTVGTSGTEVGKIGACCSKGTNLVI